MAFSNEMFAVTVPILEKIVRPIIVYAFLVLLLRVFGKRELAQLTSLDVEPSFTVQLDNEWEPTPGDLSQPELLAQLAADWSQMVNSVELDAPEVGAGDYWERIEGQVNIDQSLKDSLRRAYGG